MLISINFYITKYLLLQQNKFHYINMGQNAYGLKGLKGLQGLKKLEGLGALSNVEARAFIDANASKLVPYASDPWAYNIRANVLYMNQIFKDTFGQEAFDKYNNDDEASYNYRNEMLKSKFIKDAWTQYASPLYIRNGKKYRDNNRGVGADYEKLSELSNEGKLELMRSNYKKPSELSAMRKKAMAEELSKNHQTPITAPSIGFIVTAPDEGAVEKMYQQTKEQNKIILDDIYNRDIDRQRSNYAIRNAVEQEEYNIENTLKPTQIKKEFIKTITHSDTNLGIPEFESHYGKGTPDDVSSEMGDFSIEDMKEVIAKKRVYDKAFSPGMAQIMLNNDAKDYIADHQGWFKTKWLQGKDFLISTASYTADKVNGLYNLGLMAADAIGDTPQVYVNERGDVVDPNTKFKVGNKGLLYYTDAKGKNHTAHKMAVSRTALHSMGLNQDGSKDTSILNPEYWTKAEQYKTWSSDLQDKYAEIGSSPYSVAYRHDDEDSHFAYETMKMATFGMADQLAQLVPYGIGATGRWLSTASKLGKAVNTFGKALDFTGRALTAENAFGRYAQGTAGALGISYAYSRGAFPETLQKNMSDLEDTVTAKSWAEVQNLYETNADFKNEVDRLSSQRAAQMKQQYLASIRKDGNNQVFDMNAVDKYINNEAKKAVITEIVNNKIVENKSTEEYAQMQQKAIQGAGATALGTFIPEAVKYGFVNNFGHRKFMYTNPAGLRRKVSTAFKGLEEATTKDGAKRLAMNTSKFLTNKAKVWELTKTAGKQAWGGAWTNGTDDMMVDGAQRVNDDAYARYLKAYQSGEPEADVNGLADGAYSYIMGLYNSLGQATTANATAVGAAGSIFSFAPNFINIGSYLTKKGRKKFNDTYKVQAIRNKEGNVEFKQQNPGWRDKINFWFSNGVMNDYYAKKATEADNYRHMQYVNKILDDNGDFEAFKGIVSAEISGQNYNNMGDEKTGEYLKALEQARLLRQLQQSKGDPTMLSSVITEAKDLLEKLGSSDFSVDSTVKSGLTPEETESILTQYYAKNKGIPRTEEEDAKALNLIAKNARTLKEATDAYEDAAKHIQKIEKETGTTFDPMVKHSIAINKALAGHWGERVRSMKAEVGDASNSSRAEGETLIATLGGRSNAESLNTVNIKQVEDFKELVKTRQEETKKAKEELEKTVEEWKKAQEEDNSEAKVKAEEKYKEANKAYDNAKANEEYAQALLSNATERKTTLMQALSKEPTMSKEQADKVAKIQRQIDEVNTQLQKNTKNGKPAKGKYKEVQKLQSKLKALEKQKEEASVIPEKTLTADEILSLDVVSRARMLDPMNEGLYSEKQLAEIEKAKSKLVNKDADALNKVQDIALLTQRIDTVNDAYNRLIQHPEGAAFQYEAQRENAIMESASLFNYKSANSIAEMVKRITKEGDIPKEYQEGLIKGLLRTIDSRLLKEVNRYNLLPNYKDEITKAADYSETYNDIQSIIDMAEDKDDIWRQQAKVLIDSVTRDAETKDDILNALDKAAEDLKESNTPQSEILKYIQDKYETLTSLQNSTSTVEDSKAKKERQETEAKERQEKREQAVEKANATAEKKAEEEAAKAKEAAEKEAKEKDEGSPEEGKENKEEQKEKEKEEQKEKQEDKETAGKEENREENKETKPQDETPQESRESTPEEQQGKEIATTPEEKVGHLIANGDEVQGRTSTVEEQMEEHKEEAQKVTVVDNSNAKDENTLNEEGMQQIEEAPTNFSANAMMRYIVAALKKKFLSLKKGDNPHDPMNNFYAWLDAAGINLQNIVDHELSAILQNNPHAKVKFMGITPAKNATHDDTVANHLMLVLDYDDKVNEDITSIHNPDNGGVIETNGKKYLIIGTVGYGKQGDPRNANRFELFKNLWDFYKEGGINLKKRRVKFFEEHPNERFFVDESLSTEVVPYSLIPGWIVHTRNAEEKKDDRSILELLDPKNGRNPLGLQLSEVAWGIQTQKGFLTVNTSTPVMTPTNEVANIGRVFVLIPASNGKLMPSPVKPLKYNEMKQGALATKIDTLLKNLTDVNSTYQSRLDATISLLDIFLLDPERDNIVINPRRKEVSLAQNGEIFARFDLENGFNFDDFMTAFKQMNPRINVTFQKLLNEKSIRELAEAGALSTDAAALATFGSTYSVYAINKEGKMIKPVSATTNEQIAPKGSSDFKSSETQVIYNKEFYTEREGKFYLRGEEITDEKTLKQLQYNKEVMDRELSPIRSNGSLEYYTIKSGDAPLLITIDKNTKEVKELSQEKSAEIIKEEEERKLKEAKEKAIEENLEKVKTQEPTNVEDVDLGLGTDDNIQIDPETGEIISETPQAEKDTLTPEEEIQKEGDNTSIPQGEDGGETKESTPNNTLEAPTLNPAEHPTTQTFQQLIKNRKFMGKIFKTLKAKWPTASMKPKDLEKLLRDNDIDVDTIGTSDKDIEAWIHTIECR